MGKTKLKRLKVSEVSLVDAGANQHAHVTIFKRAEPGKGVAKDARTFSEQVAAQEKREIGNQIYSIIDALGSSLSSILYDDEVTDKCSMYEKALGEFYETAKAMCSSWGSGGASKITKLADIPEEYLKRHLEHIQEELRQREKEPAGAAVPIVTNKSKGGNDDMGLDVSKMTPIDAIAYQELQKRYGGGGEAPAEPAAQEPAQEPAVAKNAPASEGAAPTPAPAEPAAAPAPKSVEELYKSLPTAFRAEFEAMKKKLADADHRQMVEVAKKYQILGNDPEELAKRLEAVKAVSEEAYGSMVGTLDAAVQSIEASNTFGEIGKRGVSAGSEDTVEKIHKIAAEIVKADPKTSYDSAVMKAWDLHPELVAEYEASRS